MINQLKNSIKAGFPGIVIPSAEVARGVDVVKAVVAEFNKEVKDLKTSDFLKQHGYQLKVWNTIEGYRDESDSIIKDTADPQRAIKYIQMDDAQACIYVMQNLHFFWDDVMMKPGICQAIMDVARLRLPHKHLIVIGPHGSIPIEIAHLFQTVDFSLPTKDELMLICNKFDAVLKKNKLNEDQKKEIADAAAGMTAFEAENSMRAAIVASKGKGIDPLMIQEEKARSVKKSGLLEYEKSILTVSNVGGLEEIKDWLDDLSFIYHNREAAEAYGAPMPKGLLITGISGTGKSLIAKVIANMFKVPFFRGDIGKLFGSLVGETEQKTESFFRLVDSVSPSVILLDEIEKMLAGMESSGASDAGVTARLIGRLLTYMQDKKNSSFFVATANDVSKLKPELLRKGRFNQVFFVDLPNRDERAAIFKIHIANTKRKPEDYDLDQLVKASEGYVGAEIEGFITDAMYKAFRQGVEYNTQHLLDAISITPALSKTKEAEINALREWARGRARKANRSNLVAVTGDGLGEFDGTDILTEGEA